MVIAIDYDDTFTQDPAFWRRFCMMAMGSGHHVILVTNRQGTRQDARELQRLRGCVREIIFAQEGPKRYAARVRGYDPHVWIDDNPSTVDYGL